LILNNKNRSKPPEVQVLQSQTNLDQLWPFYKMAGIDPKPVKMAGIDPKHHGWN
jgi:hypothetical protein